MVLGFLLGGAVAVVSVIAGGGIAMLATHMDKRASVDPDSLSGRLTKSLQERDRRKEEERAAKDAGEPVPSWRS